MGRRTTECARARSVHGTVVMLSCECIRLPLKQAVLRPLNMFRSHGEFCHKVKISNLV